MVVGATAYDTRNYGSKEIPMLLAMRITMKRSGMKTETNIDIAGNLNCNRLYTFLHILLIKIIIYFSLKI